MDHPDSAPKVPSGQQIDLFRAVEDVHELTGAIVVLLTDHDSFDYELIARSSSVASS